MIITCEKKHLEQRCRERGKSYAEVSACIIDENGDRITVDTNHAAYPKPPEGEPPAVEYNEPPPEGSGPGTELKRLLSGWPFRIQATPNCSCNARAAVMDENERRAPGWCEKNIDQIVGWLREEAKKRGLPFMDAAGRLLVRRAIKAAKKRSTS